MPPKKGPRNSMPARINHANNATLTPSRRSPRVPALNKSSSESSQSLKSLDLSAAPPESSFNIRFYNPQSPSTPTKTPVPHSKSRTPSSDAPLTRRRTFQARPSRLSTVYTPVVDTPSSSQSSRRTRRTAALEASQLDSSDQDLPELLGTTGWTFDQYMGKFDINDNMAPKKTATSTSSNGARSSTRVRKPTTRAMEASEFKGKPRQAKASTPAPAPAPVPEKATKATASAPKGVVKKGKQPTKGKKALKKIVLKKLQVDADQAGLKLYQVAASALKGDFDIPTDYAKFIADARAAYEQRQADAAQIANGHTTNGVNGDKAPPTEKEATAKKIKAPEKEVSPTRIILKFKRSAPPKIETDGWTRAGRVNDNGEEIVLTPTNHSPYRSPHTYGDEELPFPPITARSDRQVENDKSLGFPPLFGDRNIPLDVVENFEKEDVTEEMARAKARGQKRRQQAPTVDTPAKKPRRKRRQRGDETPVAEPEPEPTSKAPAATTKIEGNHSPVRLKLKLNPQGAEQSPAVQPATNGTNGQENGPGPARLKLKFTTAPAAREQPPANQSAADAGREQGSGQRGGREYERGSTRGTTRGAGRGTARGNARGNTRGSERGSGSGSGRSRGRATDRGGERGGRGAGRGAARGGERGSSTTRVDRGGISKPRGRGGRGGRGRGKPSA